MDTLIKSLVLLFEEAPDYPHSVRSIDVIETHISWVILTGKYAYKIKKSVNYGFLDFSTLQKRLYYCQQELSLNRRLAASLYLDVVPIFGDIMRPSFSPGGTIIEYAVKMLQFPQSSQLDRLLQAGDLLAHHVDSLAIKIAHFHDGLRSITKQSTFGSPKLIQHAVLDNVDTINELLRQSDTQNADYLQTVANLRDWSIAEFNRLHALLQQRKDDGFIKECHGDMHLRNIIYFKNDIIIFDCLEFNQSLRCIDVINELAFIVMDLQDREQQSYANLLLNHYLSITGDYDGMRLCRYYLVYRAMVRAKVDCLRLHQSDITATDQAQILNEFSSYLRLAKRYTNLSKPTLYITHGLSGSGKSYLSNTLILFGEVICLRSDIERKRMHGISSFASSQSGINKGIYDQENTENTYKKLCNLAENLLADGWSVIVDASFLQYRHREQFRCLATELGINFVIFDCFAKEHVLQKRIIDRRKKPQNVSEASNNVLAKQIASRQELRANELDFVIQIDTDNKLSDKQIAEKVKHLTQS